MRRPLLCACLLFLLCVRLILYFTGPPEIPYTAGRACFTGIVEKKELKKDSQVFYLKDVGIAGTDTQDKKTDLGLICYTEGMMPPIGAHVLVRGDVTIYSRATNPGEFDMQKYYLYMGYGARLDVVSWEPVRKHYSVWREGLWGIRLYLGSIYDKLLPEDDSAVMKAMILGDKGDLSSEIKDLYRANGISHILAISGLHISILGMSLYRLLRKMSLPVLPSAATAVFLMVNYAILTGAGTSTVRAVTMFSLLAVADVERRSYDLPTALGLSAATTVFSDPYLLMTSTFWLSYGAVAGVAIYGPALWGDLRADDRRMRKLLQALGASFAVTVFTMPFILEYYYEIPVYSMLLNLIVVPLMSILMLFGLIMLPAGILWLPAGVATGIPCHLILKLYTFLCEAVSHLPGHMFIAGAPSVWKKILIYLVFALVILADKRMVKKILRLKREADELRMCICKLLVSMAAITLLFIRVREPFKLSLLDVGQGDGICIETPDLTVMIDGGSTSKGKLYQYQLLPFLKYEGIRKIDLWFVTHPDKDHMSALADMLSDDDCGIRIVTLVLPDVRGADEDFKELIAPALARGTEIRYNSTGRGVERGDLKILCLHPSEGYSCEDKNEYSQVLEIVNGGFYGIFTGDATKESEAAMSAGGVREMLGLKDGGYDVLKLGHHGSGSSSSEEFLKLISPHHVLISCGAGNPYGHPHKEVMERVNGMGCGIWRTDTGGCITIRQKGEDTEFETFCR